MILLPSILKLKKMGQLCGRGSKNGWEKSQKIKKMALKS